MGKLAPKLTIRPYTEEELGRKPTLLSMNDLSIQIDGVEVRGLRSLSLHLEHDDANVADMSFVFDELEVDIEALQEIEANIRARHDG